MFHYTFKLAADHYYYTRDVRVPAESYQEAEDACIALMDEGETEYALDHSDDPNA